MVFACESCRFLFSRSKMPDRCPDCGKENIRPATETETEEFKRLLADAKKQPL